MKKITTVVLLCVALQAFAGGERLIGTWKSDKENTLEYLKTHTNLTERQLDLVSQTLGKMAFVFDKTNITIRSSDWKFVSQYTVISETKTSITIQSQDPSTRKLTPTTLEFDGDCFWSTDDRIPGYKERFDKVIRK